jgi:hypothetical protein
VGDRTELCETPACMSLGVDISSLTETLYFPEREKLISFFKTDLNFNLYRRRMCNVVEKTSSISKNTAAVGMLLLKFKVP